MPLEPDEAKTVTAFIVDGVTGNVTFERYGHICVAYGCITMVSNSNAYTKIADVPTGFRAKTIAVGYDGQNKNFGIDSGLFFRADGYVRSFSLVYRVAN